MSTNERKGVQDSGEVCNVDVVWFIEAVALRKRQEAEMEAAQMKLLRFFLEVGEDG